MVEATCRETCFDGSRFYKAGGVYFIEETPFSKAHFDMQEEPPLAVPPLAVDQEIKLEAEKAVIEQPEATPKAVVSKKAPGKRAKK